MESWQFNRRVDTWVSNESVKEDPSAELRAREAEAHREKEEMRIEKRAREDVRWFDSSAS